MYRFDSLFLRTICDEIGCLLPNLEITLVDNSIAKLIYKKNIVYLEYDYRNKVCKLHQKYTKSIRNTRFKINSGLSDRLACKISKVFEEIIEYRDNVLLDQELNRNSKLCVIKSIDGYNANTNGHKIHYNEHVCDDVVTCRYMGIEFKSFIQYPDEKVLCTFVLSSKTFTVHFEDIPRLFAPIHLSRL